MNSRLLGSLRGRLYLLVFCSLLPALAIVLQAGGEWRRQAMDEYVADAKILVESLAQQQIRQAESARQILSTLSRLPEAREMRAPALSRLLSDLLVGDRTNLSLGVADPHGLIVASAYPLQEPFTVADRKYFRDAVAARAFSAGEFVHSRTLRVPTLHYAYPVVVDGELRCVLIAASRLSRFSDFFDLLPLPAMATAEVLDHAGNRLYAHPPTTPRSDAPRTLGNPPSLEGEDSGVYKVLCDDGMERLHVYKRLRLTPEAAPYLTVVVGAPVEEIQRRADVITQASLRSLAAVAIMALLASWLVGGRWVMSRIAMLLSAAEAVGAGDLAARVDGRCVGGEFGRLAAAFNDMAERLMRREEALKTSENRYKALFENAPLAIVSADAEGRIMEANPAALGMSGAPSLAEFKNVSVFQNSVFMGSGIAEDVRSCLDAGLEVLSERALITRWGRTVTLRLRLRPLGPPEKPAGVQAIVEDITESVRAKNDLLLYKKVFDCALEGISITDAKGRMLAVNPAFVRITGYGEREALGRTPRLLKSDRHDRSFYKQMWDSLLKTGEWAGEIWNRRKNGEIYPELLSISAIKDAQGQPLHYVALFHDITDMKRTEAQISHLAYHDALTGLPNRLLLVDRLRRAIAHARRIQRKIAVLFIDLDNFKTINDSLGHHVGDQLLRQAARRVTDHIRQDDTLARLGGDEFVIMAEEISEENEPVQLAERVVQAFQAPLVVMERELFITPSIGVSLFPDDGEDAETLIKNADLAMYLAKEQGRNRFRLFHAEMNERLRRRLSMEHRLRKALEADEFEPWFQPKIDARTGKVAGMEALARWRTADGVIGPADFVPLAEETGLIIPLGDMILTKACQAARVLLDRGSPLQAAVNISPKQFRQPDAGERVLAALAKAGLPPRLLQIEITESAVMSDAPRAATILRELAERGVDICLDDFGTGYSSLYYLKRFPIAQIKVDQSFVREVSYDQSDAAIVRTILLMAKALGMTTVAEGVETLDQLEFLVGEGCDQLQGYLFGHPMPLDAFMEWLDGREGRPTEVRPLGVQADAAPDAAERSGTAG